MSTIHITNGDYAAELIKTAFNTQDVIAWRDILYEGPVRADLTFEEFSQQRAEFLAKQGCGSFESIHASFQELQQQLLGLNAFDEIVLWFEHDVYDQLQLVQILSYLLEHTLTSNLSLICINRYPGIVPFLGLGQLDEQQIAGLYSCRQKIIENQLTLAKKIWDAFTGQSPLQLIELVNSDLSALPFIKNALLRYLREFPSNHNGLTWTEQYIVDSIIAGTTNIAELFERLPDVEQEYFLGMGDVTFYQVLNRLAEAETPLLKMKHTDDSNLAEVELSKLGEQVAQGEVDWLQINGIDCWRGGVHLTKENVWRYSIATNEMIGPSDLS